MFIFLVICGIIVGLFTVVGLHEAGHALAARAFGVKIKKISIGFGKPLFSITSKKGIQWIWGLWPLGGYVHLLNSRIEKVKPHELSSCFDKQPPYKRIIILLAGILANLFVAFLAFILFFMLGFKQGLPIIASVADKSIAATAGLKAHDKFLQINGNETTSWRDVGIELIKNLGKENVPIVVTTGNLQTNMRTLSLNLSLWKYKRQKNALFNGLGIEPEISKSAEQIIPGVNILKAMKKSFFETSKILEFFVIVLKQLITGAIPFGVLLGPLAIFDVMAHSFIQGISVFLYFIASLSLSVALVNLFPLPGLDGGSILYTVIEKIRGKPISVAMEILLYQLTFIVFILLLVQLTLNDLGRYFSAS